MSEQNNNCVSDRSKKSKKKYKSVPKRAPPPKIDSRITTSDDPFFGSIKPLPSDVVPTVREICSALLYTRLEISKSEGRALEQVSNIEVIDIVLNQLAENLHKFSLPMKPKSKLKTVLLHCLKLRRVFMQYSSIGKLSSFPPQKTQELCSQQSPLHV